MSTPALTTHLPTRRDRRRWAALAAAVFAIALAGAVAVMNPFRAEAAPGDPNVVFILTDDQALEEMAALPQTQALIGGRGTTFNRAYVSYPLCCPSRAAILSGQYMHNNGVKGNSAPDGGWTRFEGNGTEAKALPTWLKEAGYYNVLVGKYMNEYDAKPPPVPPGWDEWYGKLSEYDANVYGAGIYFNYHVREDPPPVGGVPCPNPPVPPPTPGEPFTCTYGSNNDDYQTDVFRDKAVEAIDRLGGSSTPFFLSVDFNAPHSPYIPAPRHLGAFAALPLAKPAGENEKDLKDKARFLRRLPRLGKGKLKQIQKRRRARLEMLLSVDEGIAAIVNELQSEGELDNTYLIFTSDNGYFSGEHRIRQGKYLPHDPSSHVPLLISGPGIPAGGISNELVSNVDVASTIASIAGATPKLAQDGRSLLPFAAAPTQTTDRPILLEGDKGQSIDDEGGEAPGSGGGDAADAARVRRFHKKLKAQKRRLKRRCKALHEKSPRRALICFKRGVENLDEEPTDKTYKLRAPAYVGLRTERYALFLYSTGEGELYDMARDPFQLDSKFRNKRYRNVRKYLLAKLPAYASCSGASCAAGIGTVPNPAKKRKPKKKAARRR